MDGKTVHLHPAARSWHFLDLRLERGMASLFFIIGLVCWPAMVRVIRAQVLALKEREFIQAARVLGASDARLLLRHFLPNILPTVVVLAALNTANTILLEAGLGYLGVGVPPPAPTWGGMIADGQSYFVAAPPHSDCPWGGHCIDCAGLQSPGSGFAGGARSQTAAMSGFPSSRDGAKWRGPHQVARNVRLVPPWRRAAVSWLALGGAVLLQRASGAGSTTSAGRGAAVGFSKRFSFPGPGVELRCHQHSAEPVAVSLPAGL